MTGDFTRNTFRPTFGYSTVRMQQGRVLLDADWNEQADIARWIERRTSADVIGPCGFPEDEAGFELIPIPGDLGIGPGRGYAGGILVENPAPAPVRLAHVSGSGANALYLVEKGPRLKLGQPLPPPDGDLSNAVTAVELEIDEEGRQSVRFSTSLGPGATKLRSAGAAIGAQPHLIGEPLPVAAGAYLAYLEVWERPIGALEDPTIREVALGGPDTCQREQVIWQVKLLALDPLVAEGEIPGPPSCKSFGDGWRPQGPAEPARLAARAESASAKVDPCALPSAGGYRSLENKLYRVEVHNGGQLGSTKVTFKWSPDNAIHRARLLEVADGVLVVDSAGKDEATAYRTDNWLEVLDEARILAGRPGFFVRLAEVNGDRLGVAELLDPDTLAPLTDNGAPDTAKLPAAGQVRRWEGGAPIEAQTDAWLPLENGVEVRLESGLLATGDYWTIPARTVSATVEWPRDPSSGAPTPLPPEGVARRYCALAILGHDGTGGWSVTDDCRHQFPPLTGLETFHYLGGDGQEAMPDLTQPNVLVPLGAPLRVGVGRGETPVAGRLVRFTVEESPNAAALSPLAGADVVSASASVLIVRTDAEGVAAAELALHPRRHRHHVTAELLDASVPAQANRAHLPIRFAANLSTAAETAYDPADCAYQLNQNIDPGRARTVQQALDKLCPAPEFRVLGGNGQLLCQGAEAPEPIRLGLWWGKAPLEGVEIALEVVSGDATVAPALLNTGPDGTAETRLIAGADPLKNDGAVRIVAKPLGAPTAPQPAQLVLHARFANADCVYLDKDICPELEASTVEEAIEGLCERIPAEEPGIGIKAVVTLVDGQDLLNDTRVLASRFVDGLAVVCTDEIAKEAFEHDHGDFTTPAKPNCFVTLHLPYPIGSDRDLWRDILLKPNQIVGFQPLTLAGTVDVPENRRNEIHWQPTDDTRRWLNGPVFEILSEAADRFLVHLTLKGNFIWLANSGDDPKVYLDGDIFGRPGGNQRVALRYPSGDGRRGGDFEMWFWLFAKTRFNPVDFPGLILTNITGIGAARRDRLAVFDITHPAEIASIEPARLAEMLSIPGDPISEDRARAFIVDARRLLTG